MKTNVYEIYTKDPETGQTGWEIEIVLSTDELIKTYPNFDCIITKNDPFFSNKPKKVWLK